MLNDYDGYKMSTQNDLRYQPKLRPGVVNEAQKVMDIVPGFPVNKRMPYNQAQMIKAIQNGMIVLISYTGEKDDFSGGRERVIYPMVLGLNKNTKNTLLRAWHLEGYSVSQSKNTEKVWRLFNVANIHWMMFVGNFYRLPPKGYKMNDRVMTEQTIARADFAQIRRNQDALIRAGKIESEEATSTTKKAQTGAPAQIEIKNTNSKLDLKNLFGNPLLDKKQAKEIKISILKTIFANDYLAIIGAMGEEGNTVKVFEAKKLMGSYKTIKSFTADQLPSAKNINGISEFDLYAFVKKL